ncbi:MAG: T9SS type A sorting domain-containing protein, partial [bacterium]
PSTLITIYDLTGRLKETVYSGTLTKGNYTFTPNIHKSGIYFVRLSTICHSDTERSEGEESNIITETKKLILVK